MSRNMINSGSFDGTEMTEETRTVKMTRLVLTGFCYPNEVIIDKKVRKIYQKFYDSMFVIAFISVFILYALIYKSILTRGSKLMRSSVSYRHLNGRRSTLLTSMATKQFNCHEKSFNATESQNNANAETKSTNSETRNSQLSIMNNLSPNLSPTGPKESPAKEVEEDNGSILNQIKNKPKTNVVQSNLSPSSLVGPRQTRN